MIYQKKEPLSPLCGPMLFYLMGQYRGIFSPFQPAMAFKNFFILLKQIRRSAKSSVGLVS
jgi:hypothetical protein